VTFDLESALSNRCVLSKCPNRLEKAHGEFAKFDVEEVMHSKELAGGTI
jgi:hypothetical protein